MANPIIKIKRGTVAPTTTLQAGEFAIDQVGKNLYLGVEVAGNVTNEIVGGNGTFATHTDVATAVTNATGSLGTMSTQNANAVAITGGTIDGTTIGATTPSTGKFTAIETDNISGQPNIFNNQTQFGWGLSGVGSNPLYVSSKLDLSIGLGVIELGGFSGCAVKGLDAPVNDNDAARKKYVDDKVSALGSVFRYEGPITNFFVPATAAATQPLDLDTLNQTTGAYYQIDYDYVGNGTNATVELTYTGLATPIKVKQGDAIVKTSTGWQKLDNVDAVVSGTANEIVVTGDENAGYTVSIDPVFSGRVTTAESDITDLETKTQNIDLANTVAGTTVMSGNVSIGNPSFPDFKVLNGQIQLNVATNSATVESYGTLNITAGGGEGGPGAWIGLKSSGHLVANGTDLEIQGFIIDGGVY